jgi:uncharacterized protein (TIGR03083 family)
MPTPILCAPLILKVDAKLIQLLASLTPPEWDLQTAAPAWKVRDVAAHLLDTSLRKLSIVRDGHTVEPPPADIAAFVHRLNAEGVTVYRRLSPAVLTGLIKTASDQFADFHESLDPFAPAAFAVSWAGEQTSLNWFDTARELTERWHHQQQIREAVNRPGIMTPELYHPVLDCFARGLPHSFRNTEAPSGTTMLVEIAGDCGGAWMLARNPNWDLTEPTSSPNRIVIPQEIAWRIFTKAPFPSGQIRIAGDPILAAQVLKTTSIVR